MSKTSAPLQALIERLEFHAAAGQMLEGLKFFPAPVVHTEGQASLPSLSLQPVTVSFEQRPGGGRRRVEVGTLEAVLELATDKTKGQPDFREWADKVADALVTGTDGEVNLVLPGSSKPLVVSPSENSGLDISFAEKITVRIELAANAVGSRRT